MAEDPYLWLEDITGDDALDWVRKHNEPTLAEFGGARFEQMRTETLDVLDTEAIGSRTYGGGATTSTTSGAMRPIRAGFGGAPRWRATAPRNPTGT